MSPISESSLKSTKFPSEWMASKLGNEVESIIGGGTPSKDIAAYWGGDIPWASVKDLTGTRLHRTQDYITSKAIQNSATNLIPAGTLITPTRMALGRVAIFDCDVAINQDLKAIFPKASLATEYLLYWFQDNAARIEAAGTGSTVKGIRLETLRDFSLLLPPLQEQRKIANILTAVDDKLDVIARQIETTQTLKQGLMQTLFSQGVGTQDADGRWVQHAEFKDSTFGPIPSKWDVKTLGEVCSNALQTGPFGSQLHAHEYQDEGVPVLMPKDLVNSRANLETAAKISQTRAEELDRHRLNLGDLIFSRRGDVARFALIDEKAQGSLCGTGCLKAIPGKAHSPAYLAHLLQLDVMRAWLEQNAVGQTMPNMNTAILAALPLVVPAARAEQERIADILDSVDAKGALLNEKWRNYRALKRGLMQKLLTGEWRVKIGTETAT
ncbi:MAG: restriction endonuclease subunit S [Delftia tsuruhatensis]